MRELPERRAHRAPSRSGGALYTKHVLSKAFPGGLRFLPPSAPAMTGDRSWRHRHGHRARVRARLHILVLRLGELPADRQGLVVAAAETGPGPGVGRAH